MRRDLPFEVGDDDWFWDEPTQAELQATCTEPTEIGRLYGPRGDLLGVVVDRRPVPFGFHPPRRRDR